MVEKRKHRVLSPIARVHYVALGAAMFGPVMAVANLIYLSHLLMARFTDNATLNSIIRAFILIGHQTIFLYALAAVSAAFFLGIKIVIRYALNRPYPDRDRAPQLFSLGVAFGAAFFALSLTKLTIVKMFWEVEVTPLYQVAFYHVLGIFGSFLIAFLVLRWVLPKVPQNLRRLPWLAAHVILVVCLTLTAVGQALPLKSRHSQVEVIAQPAADAPNIVLITIDTLRADRLEPYGYKKIETPAAKRMANEGMLYTRAMTTSPWTGPSFTTIFSGHYPGALKLEKLCTLYGEYPTIATHLTAHGYRTEAVITNPFLRGELAFDRGFTYFEHTGAPAWLQPIQGSIMQRTLMLWFYNSHDDYRAEVMTNRAAARLERLQKMDTPFFLWVHYMDPHIPYLSHADDADISFDLGYVGQFSDMFWDFRSVRAGTIQLSGADKERIAYLYDQDVAYVDRHVNRLLTKIDDLGLSANTVVIYTADHGEELFDHGSIEHGHTLYQELLHLPLIVRWPGRITGGAVNENPVSLIDLFPTISHIAGFEPPSGLPGVNVLAESIPDRTLYVENMLYGLQIKGMVRGFDKLIHDQDSAPLKLFRMDVDPKETTNALFEHRELVDQMHEQYQQWLIAQMQLSDELVGDLLNQVDLPEDLKQRLFSLGYTSPGQ